MYHQQLTCNSFPMVTILSPFTHFAASDMKGRQVATGNGTSCPGWLSCPTQLIIIVTMAGTGVQCS